MESPVSAQSSVTLNAEPNLITLARNGDADAFAVLYEKHKPRIQAVCLRMTNNTAEAEDLTQDAFICAFRKISTFRGDSVFSTWLHRVAVNTVLMHFRRKGNRQVSLDEPDPQDSHRPRYECGRMDERLAACPDRLALAQAIQELPPGYRTIFLLHEVHGYEHQEIARSLHCSIGNSKSQLHKAKLRIRELLAPRGYTCRQKAAAVKKAVATPVPVAAASIASRVLPSTDASLWLSQMPLTESNEPDCPVPTRPSSAALSARQKQLGRRKDSPFRSLVGNPEVMLSAIGQGNPSPMAESGS
jgi:RNA polymerase sigma-70 factor (ECF subfamily)